MRESLTLLAAACVGLGGCVVRPPQVQISEKTLAEHIRSVGYTDLALPSSGYKPGSLVTYQTGTPRDRKLVLRYLCSPEFMIIPDPIIDVAATSTLNSTLGGDLRFQGPQLNSLGLGASASVVDSVTLRILNVQALEQPIDKMLEIRRQKLGPACADTIADYRDRHLAFQTAKALKADVEYSAEFKGNTSAEAKANAIEKLSAFFNASGSATFGSSTKGTGLFYGVLVDPI